MRVKLGVIVSSLVLVCCMGTLASAAMGDVKWRYAVSGTNNGYFMYASDGGAGTIFVPMYSGTPDEKDVYALSAADGSLLWKYDNGYTVRRSATVSGGQLYFSMYTNFLRTVSVAGSEGWLLRPAVYLMTPPAVGPDGTLYLGSGNLPNTSAVSGNVYAVNPATGALKWTFHVATGKGFFQSMAVAADGTVYAPAQDGKLYAINPDGTEKWSYDTGIGVVAAPILSAPALSADGTVYIIGYNGTIYAINPSDGSLKWSAASGQSGSVAGNCPVVGADGVVYVRHRGQHVLYVLNPANGNVEDSIPLSNFEPMFALIGDDGMAYVAAVDQITDQNNDVFQLLIFNLTSGTIAYSKNLVNANGTMATDMNGMTMGADGTLYLSLNYPDTGAELQAVETTASGLANSSWPAWGKNPNQTFGSVLPAPSSGFSPAVNSLLLLN